MVSRQQILESAWDAHWYGPTKVLDVHVAALRRKLGVPGLIETVYGRGFRLGERVMARRIVLTMLALVGALLVTAVVPLGLLTTARERDSFREDTLLSARVLAAIAEDGLTERGATDAASAPVLAGAGRPGEVGWVYNAAGRLVAHATGALPVGDDAGAPLRAVHAGPGNAARRAARRRHAASPRGKASCRWPRACTTDSGGPRVGVVVIARSTAELDERLRVLWTVLAVDRGRRAGRPAC